MNAVLQFGACTRTTIIAAMLVLVVAVEKGLRLDVRGESMSAPTGSPTFWPRSASAPRLDRSRPYRRGVHRHCGDLPRGP